MKHFAVCTVMAGVFMLGYIPVMKYGNPYTTGFFVGIAGTVLVMSLNFKNRSDGSY